MDIGKAITFCTSVTLYSTGHWIGGTVTLAYLILCLVLERR